MKIMQANSRCYAVTEWEAIHYPDVPDWDKVWYRADDDIIEYVEYRALPEVLVEHYRWIYEPCRTGKSHVSAKKCFIGLRHREITVFFYPDDKWDENEYIAVALISHDYDNDRYNYYYDDYDDDYAYYEAYDYDIGYNICGYYSTVIHQKEEELKKIVRLIMEMECEPNIIKIDVFDCEQEHELIKNALMGYRTTEDGLPIERYPFCWIESWKNFHYRFKERFLELHNRKISIKYEHELRGDAIQIIVNCMETGKQFTIEIPERCQKIEEIGEELVWKIQEMAWEDA